MYAYSFLLSISLNFACTFLGWRESFLKILDGKVDLMANYFIIWFCFVEIFKEFTGP